MLVSLRIFTKLFENSTSEHSDENPHPHLPPTFTIPVHRTRSGMTAVQGGDDAVPLMRGGGGHPPSANAELHRIGNK